jgi:hypothetical protein
MMATFRIVQSVQYTCHGLYTQRVWFGTGKGTLVSIGFQNIGFAENFSVSQMFVGSQTEAFVQVINTSLTDTHWLAVAVVATDAADDDAESEAPTLEAKSVESFPLQKA